MGSGWFPPPEGTFTYPLLVGVDVDVGGGMGDALRRAGMGAISVFFEIVRGAGSGGVSNLLALSGLSCLSGFSGLEGGLSSLSGLSGLEGGVGGTRSIFGLGSLGGGDGFPLLVVSG